MWELRVKIFHLSINMNNIIVSISVNTIRQSFATPAFSLYFVIRYQDKNFNILVKLITDFTKKMYMQCKNSHILTEYIYKVRNKVTHGCKILSNRALYIPRGKSTQYRYRYENLFNQANFFKSLKIKWYKFKITRLLFCPSATFEM